jgi:hypothetical protein
MHSFVSNEYCFRDNYLGIIQKLPYIEALKFKV